MCKRCAVWRSLKRSFGWTNTSTSDRVIRARELHPLNLSNTGKEQHHDPQTVVWRVPLVLAKEEPENRASPQPGNVQDTRGCRKARASRAIFQAPLSEVKALGPLSRLFHRG